MSEETTLHAVHLIVEGEVQGVGFRAFTRAIADRLGISGWVRNLADGTVEILAEGTREQLRRLIEAVRRGPEAGLVTDVAVEWRPGQGTFYNFRIRYE